MSKTLVVADDLSGAADCAVAFAGDSVVLLADADSDAATLTIDADTRRMDARAAAETTRRIFARHADAEIHFKKIDSTLRGHIGVELAAARAALAARNPLVVVAPAFPATGRTMWGERLFVHGAELEADLGAMLRAAGLHDAQIYDAESDADLAAIVARARWTGRSILWAGSGGLARAVAGAKSPAPLSLPPITGSMLFLVGSHSPVSHIQARHLAQDTAITRIAPAALMEGRAVLPVLAPDHVLLVDDVPHEGPLMPAFAALVAPAAARAEAIFLTGGETARAVLGMLGITGLRVQGEVEPGIIVSRAEGGPLAGRIIVTKAGAFGAPEALRRVRDVLRGRASPLG